jgi:hypothetical protein
MRWCGLDWYGWGLGPVEGSCEHGIEPSGNAGKFLRGCTIDSSSRAHLEKCIINQLVRLPIFLCGTRRFVAVFVRARHWILSRTIWIQSAPWHPVYIFLLCRLKQVLQLFQQNFVHIYHLHIDANFFRSPRSAFHLSNICWKAQIVYLPLRCRLHVVKGFAYPHHLESQVSSKGRSHVLQVGGWAWDW